MISKETGNNANAKFWMDKQRVLWYFLYWLINKDEREIIVRATTKISNNKMI